MRDQRRATLEPVLALRRVGLDSLYAPLRDTRVALVRIAIVNKRLCAITGIMTFSSSCPASAAPRS